MPSRTRPGWQVCNDEAAVNGQEAPPCSARSRQARFLRRLARWWRESASRRSTVAALADCGPAEAARIAQDVGVSGAAELRVLAGKWPDSADLLSRRMRQINLDARRLCRSSPKSSVISSGSAPCASKRRCSRDFAKERSASSWQAYCPNDDASSVDRRRREEQAVGAANMVFGSHVG